MKAWLIVNGFVDSKKFNELYGYLSRAAVRRNIELEIKASDSFTVPVGERICGKNKPNFVLFWDKDIHLARRLEAEGIRLFNSASAIGICDSKILTALALDGKVLTPRTVIAPKTFEGVGYNKPEFVENATRVLGLPVIIKEAYGSFGAQVYLASTLDEAKKIVSSLGHKDFVMQEFIAESRGRDVRVNVVGGRVVSAMERYNENDFRSNISNGGSMRKINLSPEMERAAVDAAMAIGLDFAGVDVLFGKDGPIVCEVNSNPHFKSSLECTGVDMSEKIMEYILEQMK
ncbi:MAG: RimK family alpha-L-glutamate ligase [Clostridia bacterium]|nr:RimK family alpha-L-glutamate ligase [Clostridia bacterium]